MRIAVFPGAFNPFTLGHLDIAKRASTLCDTLYIAVYKESSKNAKLIPYGKRIALIEKACKNLPYVKVISFDGLIADLLANYPGAFLLRGIRNTTDWNYETQMAHTNKALFDVETSFLATKPEYSHISSTLVREIASLSEHSLEKLVPPEIEKELRSLLSAQ